MKIYTKTGDDGSTGILGGARVEKTSAVIRAIGDVDELNAALGLALCHAQASTLASTLGTIQNRLFDLGAQLAAPGDGRWQLFAGGAEAIEQLETSIDRQTDALPPLKQFILPGGSSLAAHLHHARAICRRAERSVLELHAQQPILPEVLVFLNRLSDWLFVAARTANAELGIPDVPWQKTEDQ